MKLTAVLLFGLAGLAIPCHGITRGYIQVKGAKWDKVYNLSTSFDPYDGEVEASLTDPALLVQIDLKKAQTSESDIEVLNGFWIEYPYLGVTVRDTFSMNWHPPYSPRFDFVYVQQTPSATLQRKENSLTACYPNSLEALPYQASAVWKFDPSNGRLAPTFIAQNGTRLPLVIYGGEYEGKVGFSALPPPIANSEEIELYFIPATA
ncbi:hypothetical protein DFP72DRAFT_107011 [Ephemerocybe angulata]|uniref:Uncharacterized protein n=1 Tax=Ephemerocybe angulata TaxID=980116 RepID=A0A8H6HDK4_9AGAR|nr:hypothetical protein DFP72DRAFT_107011 [Tulosesus angulatus]